MSDNQEWEVYDVKTGKTLEVVQAANKGAAADQVFDKYANQGIGFNVRPWVDPKTLTPRAKLAKRISEPRQKGDWDVIYKPTGRVIDNILRVDKEEAQRLLAKVAILHDFENADNLEIRPQQATKEPAVPEVPMDIAQNFDQPQDATEIQRNWNIVLQDNGEVIDTVSGASLSQAEAVLNDTARRFNVSPDSLSLRSTGLTESVDAITGRGVVVPNIMPKVNSQPKVKPTPPAIKVDVDKKKEDPLAYTYKKLVKENLVNLLIAIDQDTWLLCESDKRVELRKSRIFDQTVADKSKQLPNLPVKIQEFLAFKTAHPGQPWGKDTPFVSAGPLAKVPKLRHVHLTRDFSLFYSVDGRDPTVIKLYGVFDHKESGTGTPSNINRQKNLAKQLGNQFALAEGDNPADTLYFFDVGRGGRSFNHLDLRIMGLRQTKSGKWYYQPGRDSTDLLTNASIKHLEKTLNVYARPWKKPMDENFANGKGPGRPGDSVRHGIPKHATMAELEKASHSAGRKGQLARWQLNMRRGHKK
jgi:hypothetical protein